MLNGLKTGVFSSGRKSFLGRHTALAIGMALLLPQSHQSCMREEIVGPPVLVGDIRDLGKHPRTFQLEIPGCGFPVWGLCEPPPSVPGCLRSQIQQPSLLLMPAHL